MVRLGFGREGYQGTNPDRDLMGASHALVCLLNLEKAVDAHGNDGNSEIVSQQSHPGAKPAQFAVGRVMTFGEDQDAVPRSTDSPANAKLSRNPASRRSG